jgi:hypothetical protein
VTPPGGYVVIEFGSAGNEDCPLSQCPATATWFASFELADAYMATLPGWTQPHRLPLCGWDPRTDLRAL